MWSTPANITSFGAWPSPVNLAGFDFGEIAVQAVAAEQIRRPYRDCFELILAD